MAGDDFTKRYFEWLKAIAADPGLKPAAFKLAFHIGEHFNRETGKAWPGVDRLASLMPTDARTVNRLSQQLKGRGWLTIGYRKGPNHTNIYEASTPDKSAFSNPITQDKTAPSEDSYSGQKCTEKESLRTISTPTQDNSDTHSGQPAPLNYLELPQNLNSEKNGFKGSDGKWTIPCESHAGHAWSRHCAAKGLMQPIRSTRTDMFVGLPKQYPDAEESAA